MAKFKQFLLNEEIGLANLGVRVEKFYTDPSVESKINGAFVTSHWNNTNHTPWKGEGSLQNVKIPIDLTIPHIEKTGRILSINKKQNPILIKLSDGTACLFTNKEFRSIQGEPNIGKIMTVRFQRSPQDISSNFSKIEKVVVTD